ncbi:hypothetical protein KKC88_03710 [Patescibacteria group bacterium]|nr:hypothetical protein [Patescibacteria group bacterium]
MVLTALAVFSLAVLVVGDRFHYQSLWIGGTGLMAAMLTGVSLPVITHLTLKGGPMEAFIHVMNVAWEGCHKGLAWGAGMTMFFGVIMACAFSVPYVIDSTMISMGGVMGPFSEVVTMMGWLSIPFGMLFLVIRIVVKKLWHPPTMINKGY